jgi:hypothetical protein
MYGPSPFTVVRKEARTSVIDRFPLFLDIAKMASANHSDSTYIILYFLSSDSDQELNELPEIISREPIMYQRLLNNLSHRL